MSILYRFKPDECKLILIDPKMLELSIYEDIPHLLTPVVTNPNKAVFALKWVVKEMEERYKLMSSLNVKNINSYNEKSNKIEFDQVLAYGNEKTIELGSPIVKGAKVEAELIKNAKNKTVLVFKKRRRKNSRRKNGHRQQYSLIKIKKIFSKDGSIFSEFKKAENKVTK